MQIKTGRKSLSNTSAVEDYSTFFKAVEWQKREGSKETFSGGEEKLDAWRTKHNTNAIRGRREKSARSQWLRAEIPLCLIKWAKTTPQTYFCEITSSSKVWLGLATNPNPKWTLISSASPLPAPFLSKHRQWISLSLSLWCCWMDTS